jgi:hypothetical protein
MRVWTASFHVKHPVSWLMVHGPSYRLPPPAPPGGYNHPYCAAAGVPDPAPKPLAPLVTALYARTGIWSQRTAPRTPRSA